MDFVVKLPGEPALALVFDQPSDGTDVVEITIPPLLFFVLFMSWDAESSTGFRTIVLTLVVIMVRYGGELEIDSGDVERILILVGTLRF